jgi:hypothetical protein
MGLQLFTQEAIFEVMLDRKEMVLLDDVPMQRH